MLCTATGCPRLEQYRTVTRKDARPLCDSSTTRKSEKPLAEAKGFLYFADSHL